MFYLEKPNDFSMMVEVVSCIIEARGKILLLLRQDDKPQPNTWGTPAGKKHGWETFQGAIIREIYEETGWVCINQFPHLHSTTYVKYPEQDFIYHIFHLVLPEMFVVKINSKEHKDYTWVTPTEALEMKLIPDEDLVIKHFFEIRK